MNTNRFVKSAFISLLAALPAVSMAETSHQIGLTSYGLTADAGTLVIGNFEADLTVDASGAGLVYTGAPSDNAAFRFGYHSLSVDKISDINVDGGDVKGYDLQLLLGTGLNSTGFKIYFAPGYFSETVSFDSAEQDFSGFQVGAGFGYNWESVSVELWGNWRDGKDYDDFLADYVPQDLADQLDTKVASAGVSIAVRF